MSTIRLRCQGHGVRQRCAVRSDLRVKNQAVSNYLLARLPTAEIVVANVTTASSIQAAAAVGVEVELIGKSVVFASANSTALVVISAARRVFLAKLRTAADDGSLKVAAPAVVLERTSYPVGGVSPLVVPSGISLFVDQGLFELQSVWVSAGTPSSVVKLSREQLSELFLDKACDLAEDS